MAKRVFLQGNDDDRPDGSITWDEHAEAWTIYKDVYGGGRDILKIAQEGGFSYRNLCKYLGHEPRTWLPLGRPQQEGALK
jgi:hypothetical protein